jgi:hypothetical protein
VTNSIFVEHLRCERVITCCIQNLKFQCMVPRLTVDYVLAIVVACSYA